METWLEAVLTFKEIDQRHRSPKGTAFRAFKALVTSLREGEDFFYLNADDHATTLAALRDAQRLYSSTVHGVLITAKGYERLCTRLPPVVDS